MVIVTVRCGSRWRGVAPLPRTDSLASPRTMDLAKKTEPSDSGRRLGADPYWAFSGYDHDTPAGAPRDLVVSGAPAGGAGCRLPRAIVVAEGSNETEAALRRALSLPLRRSLPIHEVKESQDRQNAMDEGHPGGPRSRASRRA